MHFYFIYIFYSFHICLPQDKLYAVTPNTKPDIPLGYSWFLFLVHLFTVSSVVVSSIEEQVYWDMVPSVEGY